MRLPAPVGLSGLSTWIPSERQSAQEAVALGLIEEDTAQELGYTGLPIAQLSPPEMAVLAARRALSRADSDNSTGTGLVLHAWMHYQGHDLWSPAHYIADQLGMGDAVPVGIQQVCNGGATAIEMAVARLATEPAVGRALVTTADRFADRGGDSKQAQGRLLPGAALKCQQHRGRRQDHEPKRKGDGVDAQIKSRAEAKRAEVELLRRAHGQPDGEQGDQGRPGAGAHGERAGVESAETECGDHAGRDERQQYRRKQCGGRHRARLL